MQSQTNLAHKIKCVQRSTIKQNNLRFCSSNYGKSKQLEAYRSFYIRLHLGHDLKVSIKNTLVRHLFGTG